MKRMLYVDMDGTMFDLKNKIVTRLGYSQAHYTTRALWDRDIHGLEYDRGLFRDLDMLPLAHYLKEIYNTLLESSFDEIRFLSYVGNHDKIWRVVDDKRFCLKQHGFRPDHLIPVVGDKLNKAYFAREGAVLLDDDETICKLFNEVPGAKAIQINPSITTTIEGGHKMLLEALGIQ
jgi:hypothetical protein